VAPAGQQRRPTAIEQVIGFSVQHLLSLTPDTLYETTPKWHGLLMIKLAASMAVPGLNSKQIERRTSNVQHRTSNIDDATLYLILKQANRSL
jgi:hypothetical protein